MTQAIITNNREVVSVTGLMGAPTLAAVDYVIIVTYFLILFGFSSYSTLLRLFRSYRKKSALQTEGTNDNQNGGDETPSDYFLNSGGTPWWAVACTYFASNIGSDAIVGTAGAASYTGMPVALFDWLSAVLTFPLLTFFILPSFLKAKVFTMPEYIQLRIGPRARLYLAGIHLFRFTAWIGGLLYSSQVVCETLLGWNPIVATAALVILTGIYTSIGGLKAVVITEVLQTVLILSGSITCLVLALSAVGGWQVLKTELPPFWFHLYQTGTNFELPSYPFPWWSMTFGLPILAINYHCYDQEMTQRGLSAKNLPHGTLGTIAAAYLKFLPPLFYVIPGIIARVLDNTQGWNELGCPTPDLYVGECTHNDKAFVLLVKYVLPIGVRGVMVATILAAMMSSLAALFNSSSTIVTMDLYTKLKGISLSEAHEDKKLVWVGRAAAGGACVVGIAWVPVLKLMKHGLLDFVQEIAATSAPPVVVMFTAALLLPEKTITDMSAVLTLLVGHAVAICMIIFRMTSALPGALNWFVQDYMFASVFTAFVSLLTLACCIFVNPNLEQRAGTTTSNTNDQDNLDLLTKNKNLGTVLLDGSGEGATSNIAAELPEIQGNSPGEEDSQQKHNLSDNNTQELIQRMGVIEYWKDALFERNSVWAMGTVALAFGVSIIFVSLAIAFD